MEAVIRTFEPVAGTQTHGLLDCWYSAKRLWRAARERGFLITTGLKSNRWLRVADPRAPAGWAWQQLSDYTAKLAASDYVRIAWPKGDQQVYVHIVTTRVRKLYRCQVVIVRRRWMPHSRKRAIGPPAIWTPISRLCSCISRRAGRLRYSLAMAKKNWDPVLNLTTYMNCSRLESS